MLEGRAAVDLTEDHAEAVEHEARRDLDRGVFPAAAAVVAQDRQGVAVEP